MIFLVTVYWNYIGDNGGMLLNPQKFHSSMPSIFGPNEYNFVLKTIFDSCIQCSFQPTSFINRILDLFSSSNDKKKYSSTQIKCIFHRIFVFQKNFNFYLFSGKWNFNKYSID